MLNFPTKKLIRFNFIILFLIIFITSCTSDSNKTFNILDEAKTFFYEELGLEARKKEKTIENQEVKKIDKIEDLDEAKNREESANQKILEKGKNEFNKSTEIIDSMNEDKLTERENNKKKAIKEKILQSRLLREDEIDNNDRIENIETEVDSVPPFSIDNKLSLNTNRTQIGVLLPLTGEKKNIGLTILRALEIGIFQNANSNIDLVIKDTKADPIETIKVFDELLSMKIENFIGPLFSSSLLAIEDTVLISKVKVFALTNNTVMANKNIWVFGVDPQQQARKISSFAIKEGIDKLALLLPNSEYGYLISETIKSTLEKSGLVPERIEFFDDNIESQEVAAKNISKGFSEYYEAIDTVKNKEADKDKKPEEEKSLEIDKPFEGVLIAASGQNLTVLASQLQYNGVNPKDVSYLGMSSWEKNSILREPALDGGFFSTTSDGYQKNVKKIYKIHFKEDMTNISMLAYDILALLSINLKDHKKINTINLINEEGFIGLRGLFRLKENGIVERAFQIKKIKNKKFYTYKKAPENFYSIY